MGEAEKLALKYLRTSRALVGSFKDDLKISTEQYEITMNTLKILIDKIKAEKIKILGEKEVFIYDN